MNFMVVIGISHKCLNLNLQEKVALASASIEQAYFDITKDLKLTEVVWLSTCGRTECIAIGNTDVIKNWFCSYFQLSSKEAAQVHIYENTEALSYLLEITCGLQSKIIGELQILGQIKHAINQAQKHQTLGPNLSFWLPTIRSEAKTIRELSGISVCAMSVPNMIKKIISKKVQDYNMIVVGAGFISQQNLNFFTQQKSYKLKIIGRNREAIVNLSQQLNIDFGLMSSLPESLNSASILITATSSDLPFISKELIAKVQKTRKYKTLLIFDLAIPRDVETEVAEIDGVILTSLSDVSDKIMAEKSLQKTTIAFTKTLIQQAIKKQSHLYATKDNNHTLLEFRNNIDMLANECLTWGNKELEKGVAANIVLAKTVRRLSRKIMHGPTTLLKKASNLGQKEHLRYMNIFIKSLNKMDEPDAH